MTARGKVGPIFFRILHGKTMISNRPPRGSKFTPAQLANQQRFGESSKTVKAMLKDPAIKSEYQARVDNQKFIAQMVSQSDVMARLPQRN